MSQLRLRLVKHRMIRSWVELPRGVARALPREEMHRRRGSPDRHVDAPRTATWQLVVGAPMLDVTNSIVTDLDVVVCQ